jgi:hypothetical protein
MQERLGIDFFEPFVFFFLFGNELILQCSLADVKTAFLIQTALYIKPPIIDIPHPAESFGKQNLLLFGGVYSIFVGS